MLSIKKIHKGYISGRIKNEKTREKKKKGVPCISKSWLRKTPLNQPPPPKKHQKTFFF